MPSSFSFAFFRSPFFCFLRFLVDSHFSSSHCVYHFQIDANSTRAHQISKGSSKERVVKVPFSFFYHQNSYHDRTFFPREMT